MTLNRRTLREILDLRDEQGVLSVYLTADPREEAAARPAWQVRTDRGLDEVRASLGGDRRRSLALGRRLHQLRSTLDQVLDPSASGRGRALFAPLGSARTLTVEAQHSFPDVVQFAPVPHVVPLLAVWTLGAPAGAVLVSGDGIRLVDLRFGTAVDGATLAYQDTSDRRWLAGPAADNPARGQRSAPQRDLFNRRAAQRLVAFLRGAGPEVAASARRSGWEDLVVVGEPDLATAVVAGLPVDSGPPAFTVAHSLARASGAEVVTAVGEELAAVRRERAHRLAAEIRQAALAGGRGAYGLADVLTALGEGRVAHLVLDRDGRWSGRRAPDGRLVPAGEVPPGVSGGELVDEPYLGDRMVISAHRAGAEVTVLDGLDELAPAHGVAALLRW